MSSWFSVSLPNPFKSDDHNSSPPPSPPDNSPSHPGGVKEDLSVLGQTIGRQLRGVAAFLAPQQPQPAAVAPAAEEESSSLAILGIRNDLVEIGGSFKSSLSSLLSPNKAVSEISRFASNLLQFQEEEEREDEDEGEVDDEEAYEVAGVTDEVLEFVEEISLRPECWTDFPLSLDHDFNMSDAQKEHASTVERLVPSLADLRHKSCNALSDEKFWMIYFIFLLPRLHEQDVKLLSTPEIVEAREILLQKLRNRRNAPVETPEESQTINLTQEDGVKDNNNQGEGSPSQQQDVSVETSSSEQRVQIDHDDIVVEEEQVNVCTTPADAKKQHENEEEISFSDLEDDENDDSDLSGRLSRLRQARDPNGSNEWVRLNENSGTQSGSGQKAGQTTSREKDSEGEESNDWLTVDEVDLESLAVV